VEHARGAAVDWHLVTERSLVRRLVSTDIYRPKKNAFVLLLAVYEEFTLMVQISL
jgi:hypothetical protein